MRKGGEVKNGEEGTPKLWDDSAFEIIDWRNRYGAVWQFDYAHRCYLADHLKWIYGAGGQSGQVLCKDQQEKLYRRGGYVLHSVCGSDYITEHG